MLRLFIAIAIPDNVKNYLVSLCYGANNIKWISPANFHLTLKFIGEVNLVQYNEIRYALGLINYSPFLVNIHKVDFFGNKKSPNSIWAGVDTYHDDKELEDDSVHNIYAFNRLVEDELFKIGIKKEKRKFCPHITLGKFKKATNRDIAHYFQGLEFYPQDPFQVTGFNLYSSKLGESSAVYTLEESYLF
ncbi:MAG: RNA 2',3'-cyclic phosphodiesterase [Bacteriovoracaceae bacterium]|nr:RNA 2',3'-cyclic phosphodiesterase [Bacteriovoracaceae bacterium]